MSPSIPSYGLQSSSVIYPTGLSSASPSYPSDHCREDYSVAEPESHSSINTVSTSISCAAAVDSPSSRCSSESFAIITGLSVATEIFCQTCSCSATAASKRFGRDAKTTFNDGTVGGEDGGGEVGGVEGRSTSEKRQQYQPYYLRRGDSASSAGNQACLLGGRATTSCSLCGGRKRRKEAGGYCLEGRRERGRGGRETGGNREERKVEEDGVKEVFECTKVVTCEEYGHNPVIWTQPFHHSSAGSPQHRFTGGDCKCDKATTSPSSFSSSSPSSSSCAFCSSSAALVARRPSCEELLGYPENMSDEEEESPVDEEDGAVVAALSPYSLRNSLNCSQLPTSIASLCSGCAASLGTDAADFPVPSSYPITAPSTSSGGDGDGHSFSKAGQGYVPANPYKLPSWARGLLQITELPFLILFVYLTYFVIIVILTAAHVRKLVWLNALVAGILVGIGLNANAYRAIMYRGTLDVGMVVRFFLIPFGVSALSGLTSSMRDQFMLVFPKDILELCVSVISPAVVVCCLLLLRLYILRRHRVPISVRNLILNGRIYA